MNDDMFLEAEIINDLTYDPHLYHISDVASRSMSACGNTYGDIASEEQLVNCATCKAIISERAAQAWNDAFDQQLFTFTAVHNETGEETVLYGHATHSSMIFALAKAHQDNCWLKVTPYVDLEHKFKCDYDKCEGHPNQWNYCSMERRYGLAARWMDGTEVSDGRV
jgi:hypothetical protein